MTDMDYGLVEIGNIAAKASSDDLYKLNYRSLIFLDSEEAEFLATLIYKAH